MDAAPLSPRRRRAARVLAIVGTVVAALPLAAPFVLSLVALALGAGLLFDFLMPGELVGLVLAGGVILVAAALVGRLGWVAPTVCTALAGLLFVATMGASTATGLASGPTEPEGWPLVLVLGVYALYVVAAASVWVIGVRLWQRVFRG